MNVAEAFDKYLEEVFETKFDETNIDHLVKRSIFIAGWKAALEEVKRYIKK